MEQELMNGTQEPESEESVTATEEKAGKEESKTYTQVEVDDIVKKRLARERKRMSSMFAEETQVNELEEREQRILKRELMADAKITLVEHGLPALLANILTYESKEAHDKHLKEVMDVFNEAVEQGVKMRLRGNTPRTSNTSNYAAYQKDAVAKAFKP